MVSRARAPAAAAPFIRNLAIATRSRSGSNRVPNLRNVVIDRVTSHRHRYPDDRDQLRHGPPVAWQGVQVPGLLLQPQRHDAVWKRYRHHFAQLALWL